MLYVGPQCQALSVHEGLIFYEVSINKMGISSVRLFHANRPPDQSVLISDVTQHKADSKCPPADELYCIMFFDHWFG